MSKETADISSSPGLILRTAREELKFSIDHVAHDLHLRASVVQSMENEDYDDFSSDVFLKGYFRSYCRLVNLHEERMVELLEVQLRTRKNEIENVALSAKKAEKAKFRKKLISVMFALALVAGLSVYVLGYLLVEDKPLQEGSPLPESTTSAPSDQSLSTETEGQQLMLNKPKSEAQDTLEDSPKSALPTATNAAQTLANEKIVIKAVPEETEGNTSTASLEDAPNIVEPGTDSDKPPVVEEKQFFNASFTAEFSGDCWFKFTNAEGKTVFAALKRAGNKVNYTGPAPFTMVLGDAKQVQVEFEGK
ncbi:hypothetical protein A3749_11135, partial [Oleiphilus sp. HI0078]